MFYTLVHQLNVIVGDGTIDTIHPKNGTTETELRAPTASRARLQRRNDIKKLIIQRTINRRTPITIIIIITLITNGQRQRQINA
jgi:hypothetical protein